MTKDKKDAEILACHEAFEKWAKDGRHLTLQRSVKCSKRYWHINTVASWKAWQAAWNHNPAIKDNEGLVEKTLFIFNRDKKRIFEEAEKYNSLYQKSDGDTGSHKMYAEDLKSEAFNMVLLINEMHHLLERFDRCKTALQQPPIANHIVQAQEVDGSKPQKCSIGCDCTYCTPSPSSGDELKQAREALGAISRMKVNPDNQITRFTLTAAITLAEKALTSQPVSGGESTKKRN